MHESTPLAFIDVETTGLRPGIDRITEIGVVTASRGIVERWTTLVNSGRSADPPRAARPRSAVDASDAPRFSEIAAGLQRRLAGHLLIAHNARFDFAFLNAEFSRVNMMLEPAIVCSVMLARKFYPHLAHHDLDTLADHHGLRVDIRHRALPDADLLWQFWQALCRDHAALLIDRAIEDLLAGPVLPAHLDPALIDRMPDVPGAYVLHGEQNVPLHVGAADNLRLRVRDYFRIDRASRSALQMSHRVTSITWHATQGPLGARLRALMLGDTFDTARRRSANAPSLSWALVPHAVPSVALVSLVEDAPTETYGVFTSERKARNAMQRLAASSRLCHAMLGIVDDEGAPCLACPIDRAGSNCVRRVDRAGQLTRILVALKPTQLPRWPYPGAVGVRERRDMHVFNRWRYLGTATNDAEVHGLLVQALPDFDRGVFDLLRHELPQMPRRRIVDLAPFCVDSAEFSREVA